MRFYEAMKLLEEGKKVRRTNWSKEQYIYKNENDTAKNEDGSEYDFTWSICGEWEEYIEPGEGKIEKMNQLVYAHQTDSQRIATIFDKLNEVIDIFNKEAENG